MAAFRPMMANLKLFMADLMPAWPINRPERANLNTERVDFKPERTDYRSERADFRPGKEDFRSERVDFGPGKANTVLDY